MVSTPISSILLTNPFWNWQMIEDLSDLVDNPRETPEIEVKQWFDLSESPQALFKLASRAR